MADVTCTIRVRGRVHGVFFRASAVDQAHALGLRGTVANVPDGSVEIVATGTRPDLEHLITWCRHGPPAARVETVETTWHDRPADFPSFRILR